MANFFENVNKLFNDFRTFVKRENKPIGQADLFSLAAVFDASIRTNEIETLSKEEQLTAVYKSIFDSKYPLVDRAPTAAEINNTLLMLKKRHGKDFTDFSAQDCKLFYDFNKMDKHYSEWLKNIDTDKTMPNKDYSPLTSNEEKRDEYSSLLNHTASSISIIEEPSNPSSVYYDVKIPTIPSSEEISTTVYGGMNPVDWNIKEDNISKGGFSPENVGFVYGGMNPGNWPTKEDREIWGDIIKGGYNPKNGGIVYGGMSSPKSPEMREWDDIIRKSLDLPQKPFNANTFRKGRE